MSSGHRPANRGEVHCDCGRPSAKRAAAARQDLDEPGNWTLQITDPRQKIQRVAVHYRGIAPASLSLYIASGRVQGSTMWALVIVIAILAITDVIAGRRVE